MDYRNIKLPDRFLVDPMVPVNTTARDDCIAYAVRLAKDPPPDDGNGSYGVYYKNMSEGALGIFTTWYCRSLNCPPEGATRWLFASAGPGDLWYDPEPPRTLIADMLTCCIKCSKPDDELFIQMNAVAATAGNLWVCPRCNHTVGR